MHTCTAATSVGWVCHPKIQGTLRCSCLHRRALEVWKLQKGVCAAVEILMKVEVFAGVSTTPRSTTTSRLQHMAADLIFSSHECATAPSACQSVMHVGTHEDLKSLPQRGNDTGCVPLDFQRHNSEMHRECDQDSTEANHFSNAHTSGSSPQMQLVCTLSETDTFIDAKCCWNGTLLVQGKLAEAHTLPTRSCLRLSASACPTSTNDQILLPCTRATTNATGVVNIHAPVVQSKRDARNRMSPASPWMLFAEDLLCAVSTWSVIANILVFALNIGTSTDKRKPQAKGVVNAYQRDSKQGFMGVPVAEGVCSS